MQSNWVSYIKLFLVFSFLFVQTLPAWASQASQASGEAVTTLQLKDELDWQFETDIGTMHFYGGGELWSVDLLKNGELITDPIPLAGSDDARTVFHVPRTNMLLVARAFVGGENVDAPGKLAWLKGGRDSSLDGMNSCVIDLFSGEILWKNFPLDIPDEVHHFPATRTVVLRSIPGKETTGKKAAKKPSKFTAVDLKTGEVLWKKEYTAQAVWVNGPYLEIVGKKTVTLDAVTGKVIRIVNLSLPQKSMLMAFPAIGKILIWKKKDFTLFEIPTLTTEQINGQDLPITINAKKVWHVKAKKKLKQISNKPGLTWGPKLVSDKFLLINFIQFFEVIDLESGKSVWERKKKRALWGQDLEISPTGAYGAITKKEKLFIIDMNTGLDFAEIKIPDKKGSKTKFPKIMWQGDDELLLVFSDRKKRPHSVTRINVSEKSVHWTNSLPPPVNYKMTTKEKGKLVGGILLSVASIAVAPVIFSTGGYNYYIIFVPNLNVKQLPDSGAGLEALEAQLESQEETSESNALRRYIERSKLILDVLGKQGLFVAEKGQNRYQIISFNMGNGETNIVAEYSAPRVHGIEPDIVYGLAITQEENRKKIKVISLGTTTTE